MGCMESPPYFCAATKTIRDVAYNYCNTSIGSLAPHKFIKHVQGNIDFVALPTSMEVSQPCHYGLEVFVDIS